MLTDITAERQVGIKERESRLLWLALAFVVVTGLTLAAAFDDRGIDRVQHLVVLPVWGLVALLIHRTLNRFHPVRDPYLLPVAMLLVGWGLLTVWRLSSTLGSRQTLWVVVGAAAVIAILRGPHSLDWLRRYRYLWLTAGILLTALTLVFGTNPAGGEPRLWLGCCGVFVQPSEPLRLLLIAFVASYLADRSLADRPPSITRDVIPLVLATALAALLLFAQRDLGTATLFLAVLAFMIYVAYARGLVLIAAAVMAILGAALAYQTLTIVQWRFEGWLDPWLHASDSGYQIVQSLIAIASGGLFGSGPALGAPSFVPVVQSDLVFSAVAEEWGMLGALAMIVLFALLVGRGLRTAARRKEPFAALLSAGIAIAIGLQAILIIGGGLRLLPITGVTLPFVSYGGSSLVTSFVGLAFLLILSRAQAPGAGHFSRPVLRTQMFMSLGWVVAALALGWWAIVRGDALTSRTDNPRRSLAGLESPRGAILDRTGLFLVSTLGMRGSYERKYFEPSAAPVIGYDSSSFGQTGVESTLDPYLRGEVGPDPLKVSWNKLVYGVPPAGSDVRLTLDAEIQSAAAMALGGQSGAIVVLDAVTGDILAMASSPSFDPNELDSQWSNLVSRDDAPLLNRAAQGRYQPGMSIAPLLFSWASSEGVIEPDELVPEFQLAVHVFGRNMTCQRAVSDPAEVTWSAAVQFACPAPFAHLGELLEADRIGAFLSAFGLDAQPNIRIPLAESPLVEIASDPDSLRLEGIGQGALTVTPLQMAAAYATLAGSGVRPDLGLVEAVRPQRGEWNSLAQDSEDIVVISPTEAQVTLDTLTLYTNGLVGYEAGALSGDEQVSWFIGLTPEGIVGLVLLEEGSLPEARAIGLSLLELSLDLATLGG